MAKKIKIKGNLINSGEATRNGRIYPVKVLDEMAKQLDQKIKEKKAFITLSSKEAYVQVDRIIGEIDHMDVRETSGIDGIEEKTKHIDVEGSIYDLPASKYIIEMLEKGKKEDESEQKAFNRLFEVRPQGMGRISNNCVQPGYVLISSNVFPKEKK